MLKSALAKRSANAPRKPLRVSFSDIRDSEEEEEEEQQPPKQLSVNFAPDEVKKLQKELHELRKKLEEIQPAESTPSDVVVDVPPLPGALLQLSLNLLKRFHAHIRYHRDRCK